MIDPIQAFIVGLVYVYVMIVVGLAKYLRDKEISPRVTRRLIHLLAGDAIIIIPVFTSLLYPMIICVGLGVLVFLGLKRGLSVFESTMVDGVGGRLRLYGPFYYIVSIALLLLLFWDYKFIVIASTLIMAWGDGAASLVASLSTNPHKIIGRKTLEGSIGMFLFSAIAIIVSMLISTMFNIAPSTNIAEIIYITILGSLAATIIELISQGPLSPFDNFTVPLVSAVTLYLIIPR